MKVNLQKVVLLYDDCACCVFVCFTRGLFCLGWLFNETNRYEEAFFVAGGTMFLSLLLLSIVQCLLKQPSAEHETNVDNRNNSLTSNNMALEQWHVSRKDASQRYWNGMQCSNTDEQLLYVSNV